MRMSETITNRIYEARSRSQGVPSVSGNDTRLQINSRQYPQGLYKVRGPLHLSIDLKEKYTSKNKEHRTGPVPRPKANSKLSKPVRDNGHMYSLMVLNDINCTAAVDTVGSRLHIRPCHALHFRENLSLPAVFASRCAMLI